eukprot:78636-Prymnesium_polylepis.7
MEVGTALFFGVLRTISRYKKPGKLDTDALISDSHSSNASMRTCRTWMLITPETAAAGSFAGAEMAELETATSSIFAGADSSGEQTPDSGTSSAAAWAGTVEARARDISERGNSQ